MFQMANSVTEWGRGTPAESAGKSSPGMMVATTTPPSLKGKRVMVPPPRECAATAD